MVSGFIAQFGTMGGAGVEQLDPTWGTYGHPPMADSLLTDGVSVWGAMLNIGQVVTFTYISWYVPHSHNHAFILD